MTGNGSRYSKKKELADAQLSFREEACTLYEVKARFFGDAITILYGSESAVRTEADGRKRLSVTKGFIGGIT